MATSFSNLFARLGKLFGMAEDLRTNQTAMETSLTAIIGTYSAAEMERASTLINNLQRRIASTGTVLADIERASIETLIEEMDADLLAASGGSGLNSKSIRGAMIELIRQMNAESTPERIEIHTPSIAATSAVTGTGNGTMITCIAAPRKYTADVVPISPNIRQELIRATCVNDSMNKRVPSGMEEFVVEGQRSVPRTDKDWPAGSGINQRVIVASPSVDGGMGPGRNILTNSDFEEWTGDDPDNWTISTGSAGANIFRTTGSYLGTNALLIRGNDSTAFAVKQTLGENDSTLGKLVPDRCYSLSFYAKRSGNTPNTGALQVSVKNAGGTILNNGHASFQASKSIAHGSLTTSYVLHTVDFITPLVIGEGAYVEVATTTAFNTNTDVHVDHLVLAEMHRPVPGGVAFNIIAGSTAFVEGDFMTAQTTNDGAGKFAIEFDRFFDMAGMGLQLPSATGGSITRADGLIS